MEKTLDMVADAVLSVFSWVFKWFGARDDVRSVQEKVVSMCGFLPTAASVASMLSASNPVVTGVIGIATAICRAVSAATPMALMGNVGYGTVNGVPIEGDWKK